MDAICPLGKCPHTGYTLLFTITEDVEILIYIDDLNIDIEALSSWFIFFQESWFIQHNVPQSWPKTQRRSIIRCGKLLHEIHDRIQHPEFHSLMWVDPAMPTGFTHGHRYWYHREKNHWRKSQFSQKFFPWQVSRSQVLCQACDCGSQNRDRTWGCYHWWCHKPLTLYTL